MYCRGHDNTFKLLESIQIMSGANYMNCANNKLSKNTSYYWEMFIRKLQDYLGFLAVHNSSIGDLVTDSLTH